MTPPQELPATLIADELIDDQALSTASDDAFRLTDFVTELVAVCERTTLPVNVALFGAWGSGKSSLANLLEQRFKDGDHKTVAFARFDAFKYAGIALRRHLLSQLAEAFDIDGKKYGEGLYRARNTNTYELPAEDRRRFAGLLAAVAGIVALVLLGVSAIVGLVADTGSKGAFGPAFRAALEGGVPSLLFASGLVATLLAITGKTFTVQSTQAPPSTDEEFGRLFNDLVKEVVHGKGCERIVIFVDELDRCSPGQVVAVLETIKTFLHIDPCVFVVAADKQAIEQALGEQARQATPEDVVNPYYSAGSAYLDKIFQHQLSLPPLLPRTLSQFALELVAERPGTWRQIENKAELVTVLVAAHVRSPRRVKVLLNAFLLAYRLALRRAAAGAIDPDVAGRASEIAKLVCLQTEFPLFAAELRVDARMVQATLALSENPELTLEALQLTGFTAEAYARAGAYAAGRLPVDTVIARSPGPRDEPTEASEEPQPAHEDEDQPETLDATIEPQVAGIIKSQSRQLTAYLARTRKIPGPHRDLVFLESSGAAFGLPAELADTLEQSARNGIASAVLADIRALPEDMRPAGISLLCVLARDSIGVETENACHCLLEALGAMDAPLDGVVDDVLMTLQVVSDGYELRPGDLAGALEASLLRTSTPALELRRQVLRREETRTDEALGLLVLSHAQQLRDSEEEMIGPVLTARLVASEPQEVFEAVDLLPDHTLTELIRREEESLRLELGVDGGEDAPARVAALAEYAATNRTEIAPPLVQLLLGLDSQSARTEAEPLLQQIAPITDAPLIRAVLAATSLRYPSGWKQWLGPIDPTAVGELSDAAELIGSLAAHLMTKRLAAENPASGDDAREAIRLLREMMPEGEVLSGDQTEAVYRELTSTPAANNEQAEQRIVLHQLTHELAGASLMPAEDASRLIIDDVAATLAATIEIGAGTKQLPRFVLDAANIALPSASATETELLIEAVSASGWLPAEPANAIVLHGRSRQAMHDEEVLEPLPLGEIAGVAALGEAGDPAIAAWVLAFSPPPDALYEALLTATNTRKLAVALAGAVGELAGGWTQPESEQFQTLVADGFAHEHGGLMLIALTRAGAPPQSFTATQLARLFDDSNNNAERERIMQLWQATAPKSDAARRTLIERVYEPLLHQGKGAVRVALDHFAVVRTPPSKAAGNRIRAAITNAVKGDKALERRAKELQQEAGWIRRGRFRR
jgi:KAP family P-loop domain